MLLHLSISYSIFEVTPAFHIFFNVRSYYSNIQTISISKSLHHSIFFGGCLDYITLTPKPFPYSKSLHSIFLFMLDHIILTPKPFPYFKSITPPFHVSFHVKSYHSNSIPTLSQFNDNFSWW